MKMPWSDKTGTAKATIFFATLLLVSLGLCGINFAAFSIGFGGGSKLPNVFLLAGYIELTGMAIGAIGLLVMGVLAVGSAIYRKLTLPRNETEEQ